jgi:acetyltransferase-like isoleucine patch superfamily enzyme
VHTSTAARAAAAATPAVARVRRAAFVRRVALAAALAGAEVALDVALDARIGRRVHVFVAPGTRTRLSIGPGAVVSDGCRLLLKGGRIDIGGWVDLRPGVTLNASGALTVGEATVVGAGSVIHCAHEVRVGPRCAIGEYTTLVDTSHVHVAPERGIYLDTVPGRVIVGCNVFIGTKSTLGRRADIGDFSMVGANSVVTGPVPSRVLVSGVPAVEVRRLQLPWES